MPAPPRQSSWFSAVAPGVLVAATGVGAGDLLTAAMAGSEVGLAVLWAAVVGAVLKWALNEGIGRWQMATGTTLLEGWVDHFGRWIQWVFLGYLLLWSFVVAGALVTACGVAGTGLLPIGGVNTSKIVWGIIHSLVGLVLVLAGGFKVFERVMSLCIGVMFATVTLTAVLVAPDAWSDIARGLFVPSIPPDGFGWVMGILGGVGGTVTLLSYGYWIREKHRSGVAGLRACRLDLTIGYGMTALFGVAMVIIGSRIELSDGGATVAIQLADQLSGAIGPAGRWVFLVGFWGAVFSSLLGVWQSVPYLFADYMTLRSGVPVETRNTIDLAKTPAYRGYLVAMAVLPLVLLGQSVRQVQLVYAVFGALFMPLLALTLLMMNNNRTWIQRPFRNGPVVNTLLVLTMLFFAYVAGTKAVERLFIDNEKRTVHVERSRLDPGGLLTPRSRYVGTLGRDGEAGRRGAVPPRSQPDDLRDLLHSAR